MFIEKVTADQYEYAKNLVENHDFGQRGKADGSPEEQLTGMIGQTVMADLLGKERPDDKGGFDGGVDFTLNGKTFDVKTMTRTTDVHDYYVHNFIGYQKDYKVDYYVFLSFNKKTQEMTICGCTDKETFLEKAEFFPIGTKRTRSDGSYFYSKAPLYEIKQTDLTPVKSLDELIACIR